MGSNMFWWDLDRLIGFDKIGAISSFFFFLDRVLLCRKLTILLPYPFECWDYRYVPPLLILVLFSYVCVQKLY
jgi:hypothetical protein